MAEPTMSGNTIKPRPSLKKWIIRSLIILLTSFALLTGIAVVIFMTQQQRLVNLAVNELNKRIRGELTIQESDISLVKNFPYVSIALHGAKLFPDKTGKQKPLGSLERLYVGFSLPDILKQNYTIKRLFLKGGEWNIIQRADGTINLLEAVEVQSAPAQPGADTTQMQLSLDKAVLKDLYINYYDEASGQRIASDLKKLSASFGLHAKHINTELESDMLLDVTSAADTTFFRHKKVQLDLKATFQTDTRKLQIAAGNLKLEHASFNIEGAADLADTTAVDFKIKGDKPDFNMVGAFLPADVKKTLKPFKYDGRVYFDALIKGKITPDKMPLIEVSFGCEDAWFLNTEADKKVDQLGFKGFYTNGSEHSMRTSELHITNVSARPEKGVFKGNFVVRDFTDPHSLVQIRSELELRFLGEFLGIPGLKQITGKIRLDMDFKELNDIRLPEQSLNKLKEGIQSKLVVEDLSFQIPGYPHPVRNMNVHAEMRNGHIHVDSASLKIGESDLRVSGSISDVQAFIHDRSKTVTVTVNASSNKMLFKELVAHDTALSRKLDEEIRGFNVGLMLQTSVEQLLHPAPLPRGKFEMTNLRAAFKKYPHTFKDLGATLTINDTALLLRNFNGSIDSSDFRFSGRIKNYQLWFQDIKKGKTEIAFDFKSSRFSLRDVLGPLSRKLIPRGYRREIINNAWLRAKAELKYDTNFRFAKADIVNITGDLKRHKIQLKDIQGKMRYGTRVLIVDTMKGTIGRSDFDMSFRYFTGKDKKLRKKTNSFFFKSNFLDADEISNYSFAPPPRRARIKKDSAGVTVVQTVPVKVDSTTDHAKAFNIFTIPFSDFNVVVNIGKLKYNKLWLKDVEARVRMQEDQHIYIDTLHMKVADGTVGMRGHLNGSDTSKIYFRSRINVDQVDLEKMMLKLDHFGQDVVINKNIKGRLSGQIKSYVQVHPNFVPIMSKTKAELNVSIYNGSLVDFAPMQALSSYFKDKNLSMVRFDTLQNKLSFAEGVLDIPNMDINSSIGYIQMSGKQSLDLSMEYYVRVPMKLVTQVGFNSLFHKKQEEVDVTQIDEIEYIDKDKKISFMNLKVTGTPDDFKVALGKDKKRK